MPTANPGETESGTIKRRRNMLSTKEMLSLAVNALDGKMAKDIKVLEVRDRTALAEYFIICTASSTPQIKTLSDEVGRVLSENGEPPLRTEGVRAGGWILMDFGNIVVHIFMDEARKFYNLERLWVDAPEIDVNSLIINK